MTDPTVDPPPYRPGGMIRPGGEVMIRRTDSDGPWIPIGNLGQPMRFDRDPAGELPADGLTLDEVLTMTIGHVDLQTTARLRWALAGWPFDWTPPAPGIVR